MPIVGRTGSRCRVVVVNDAPGELSRTLGDPRNVVRVGTHPDPVNAGPGIQDKGSGSAAILETTLQMARVTPRSRVRFAWRGAEGSGLVGSTHCVDGLSKDDRNRITLHLNIDMIGSPNHAVVSYDGDDSDALGAGPEPAGSAAIEEVFEEFYALTNQPFTGTDVSGCPDYGPFIAARIPAGGLFTGAAGSKMAEEAATRGGTAGDRYDPCHDPACDTFDNTGLQALDVNADAVAHATLLFSMNTSMIDGAKPKGSFKVPLPTRWPLVQPPATR